MMQTPVPDNAQRSTLVTAILWVAISVAIPALGVARDVLFHRKFGAHFAGQQYLHLWGFVLVLAAPAIQQWLVLRRAVARNVALTFALLFIVSAWLSGIAAPVVDGALQQSRLNGEIAFDIARIAKRAGPADWLWLAGHFVLLALITSFVPAMIFGWCAKRSPLWFLIAIVVGTVVAAIIFKITAGFPQRFQTTFGGIDYSAANGGWTSLLGYGGLSALAGAVEGLFGACGLMLMLRSRTPG